MPSYCSPWGSRKGRNLRPPSPAKGGSWNARHFDSHSPVELATSGGRALRSHHTQPEPVAVSLAGLRNGTTACEAAAAKHAEQAQRAQRPRRTQKAAPEQLHADLAVPSVAAELSPSRLRGGPQVQRNGSLCYVMAKIKQLKGYRDMMVWDMDMFL